MKNNVNAEVVLAVGAIDDGEDFSDLFERFEPERLRTVSNFREMMPGVHDVTVEIELRDDSAARLTFPVPWDGKFYCYYRTDGYDTADKWFINDWGSGRCRLVREIGLSQPFSAFVKTDDVLQLLEDCIRIPAQRAGMAHYYNGSQFPEFL